MHTAADHITPFILIYCYGYCYFISLLFLVASLRDSRQYTAIQQPVEYKYEQKKLYCRGL